MNISNYIKDILYTHNQVNISDLGTFVRITESAKIDDKKEIIEAPKTKIIFDQTKKSKDGVLANYLVQNGKINPSDAEILVENYVLELKSKLDKGETEVFEQIGTLHLDDKKNLIFTKDENSTFLPNTFALSELKVKPVEEIPNTQEEESKKKPVWIWIAIAAAVVIILILVFPVRNYINKQKVAEQTEQNDPQLTNDDLQDDSVFIENDEQTEETENTQTEETKTQTTETEEITSINPEIKFHIIAGSFSEMVNAEKLVSELQKKGYSSASVLPKDGNWIRVSMSGFAERKAAEDEMKKINATNSGYEIWLFVVK